MSKEITELINQCKQNLERNLVSSALHQLYDAYYLKAISKREDVEIMRTRLLGHLGEYSEALRSINAIRFESEDSQTSKAHATIWAGVYWSRLGESEKALKILRSISPPSAPFYLMLYLGHLLTIAIELGDKSLANDILKEIDEHKNTVKSSETDWRELIIWEYLLTPIARGLVTRESTDRIITKVNTLKTSMDKTSFDSFVDLRIGNLYYFSRENDLARRYYDEARRKALQNYNGVAILMSNDALLNLMEKLGEKTSKKEIWKKKLRESSVVAGQHGIGLIPCSLSKSLWKRVNELDKKEKLICGSWILSERYIPDISRLKDDPFEQFCHQFFSAHCEGIIGFEANVAFSGKDQKTYDLLLSNSTIKIPFKYAVQCKGGRSRRTWTANALMSELSKQSDTSRFLESLNDLREEGITGYLFVCSTRIREDGKQWLNKIHQQVFKSDCIVLDSLSFKHYLIENPKLRFAVSMAISET